MRLSDDEAAGLRRKPAQSDRAVSGSRWTRWCSICTRRPGSCPRGSPARIFRRVGADRWRRAPCVPVRQKKSLPASRPWLRPARENRDDQDSDTRPSPAGPRGRPPCCPSVMAPSPAAKGWRRGENGEQRQPPSKRPVTRQVCPCSPGRGPLRVTGPMGVPADAEKELEGASADWASSVRRSRRKLQLPEAASGSRDSAPAPRACLATSIPTSSPPRWASPRACSRLPALGGLRKSG